MTVDYKAFKIGITKIPLTVLVPVRNEELDLQDALESVKWADEIYVVDSQSTDRTVEIAHHYTDKVVQFHYQGGWPKKKNWALDNLPFKNEWVLILDADERVPPELRDEIATVIMTDEADGYWLDRDFVFLGRHLRCMRPNWVMRLFKHRLGRYENLQTKDVRDTWDNEMHEHVIIQGRTGHLKHPLVHEDYKPLRAWVDRHNAYSDWEAKVYENFRAEPIGFNLRSLMQMDPAWRKRVLKRLAVRLPFKPLLRFLYMYFFRLGILDGRQGFIYAVFLAYYEFLIGVKQWEMQWSHGKRQVHKGAPERR